MVESKPHLLSLEPTVLEVGVSEEKCSLLANRCPRCDLVFFPRRHFCTRCCSPELEEIRLSGKGCLKSLTSVYEKPKYAAVEPPYMVGEIELPQRVVVYALLTQCSSEKLKIGAEMELTTVKVREEVQEGKHVTVLAYAFRPSSVQTKR